MTLSRLTLFNLKTYSLAALPCMLLMASVLSLNPIAASAAPKSADATPARQYSIAETTLESALNQFGREAGILLSYDPALVKGLSAPALSGKYSVLEGLRLLLTGSGLVAVDAGDGSYRVQKPSTGAMLLPTVNIATTPLGSTTEGTGSYTTGDTNTSTGLDLTPRETPQSITVMTHDRMRDQNLTEIAEVINQVVGIENNSGSALGTDGTNYVARGFTVENYQVDGIARPTAIYGFAEETADMMAYDRVEIIRGASGLTTGMGIPAATINLIRKKPTDHFQASVAAKTGSWDLYRLEADVSGAMTDDGKLRGRLASAYQENDTFIDREHVERQTIYGIGEYDFSDQTMLSLGVEYQDMENAHASRGGVPLFYTDGSETDFDVSTNTAANYSAFARESLNTFVKLEHEFNPNWRLRLDAEHKEGSYDEKIGYLSAAAVDKATGVGGTLYSARWASDLELDAFNANLQGTFDWLGRQHELGVTAYHATYQNDGPSGPGWWLRGDYSVSPINALEFFASGDWPEPDLSTTGGSSGSEIKTTALSAVAHLKPSETVSVIIGARVSDWEQEQWSKSANGEKTTTPLVNENGMVTPYAGVIVDITQHWSAYASYTQIFEPQTYKELDGSVLDPLEGNNYELGVKGEYLNGRLNASAAVFRMQQENYAVAFGAGIYAPDGSIAYRAEDGAESQGVELEIGGQLLPGWQVAGGFARATVENNEGERLNTEIPTNTFKFFSTYQLTGNLSGLTLGGNLRWQSSSSRENAGPNGEEYKQDSLVLVDMLANYIVSEHLRVAMNVDNLFDKKYYSGLSGRGRFGEPRSFSLSVSYEF